MTLLMYFAACVMLNWRKPSALIRATAVLGLSDVEFSDNPVVAVGQLDMRLRGGSNNC